MISAPAIRVAVNDRQLPVVAVEDGSRILVPFRALVEALGGHVSQFRFPLPAPARVIAGRTYVPVRYIATQLHAAVEYDARTRVVQVFTNHSVAAAEPPASINPNEGGPIAPEEPTPNSRVATAYPTISANLPISAGTAIATLRVLVDHVDVTQDARYGGTFVTYIPRDGLQTGLHTVSVDGVGTDGRKVQSSWTFETTVAPALDVADTGATSPFNSLTPIELNVGGNQFVGGSPVSVQMTAPPGGQAYAFVCTSAWHYPLYAAPLSQFYSASIPTESVGAAIDCPITAMYVALDGTVTYAPYPVFVQLLPPRTPSPPAPRVQPTHVALPEPTRIPPPESTPEPHPRSGTPRVRPRATPF